MYLSLYIFFMSLYILLTISMHVDLPEIDLPGYEISTNGTARTSDGSPVSPLCAASYTQTLMANTNKMAAQVNQIIGDSLCPGSVDLTLSSTTMQMAFDVDIVIIYQFTLHTYFLYKIVCSVLINFQIGKEHRIGYCYGWEFACLCFNVWTYS